LQICIHCNPARATQLHQQTCTTAEPNDDPPSVGVDAALKVM